MLGFACLCQLTPCMPIQHAFAMHGMEVLSEGKPTMISFQDRFGLMLAALFMHVKWDRALALRHV